MIDEMRILTFPVTVGNGKRLFGGGTAPATLEVTKSVSSKTGVQMAVLQPRGDLQTGSFSPED